MWNNGRKNKPNGRYRAGIGVEAGSTRGSINPDRRWSQSRHGSVTPARWLAKRMTSTAGRERPVEMELAPRVVRDCLKPSRLLGYLWVAASHSRTTARHGMARACSSMARLGTAWYDPKANRVVPCLSMGGRVPTLAWHTDTRVRPAQSAVASFTLVLAFSPPP